MLGGTAALRFVRTLRVSRVLGASAQRARLRQNGVSKKSHIRSNQTRAQQRHEPKSSSLLTRCIHDVLLVHFHAVSVALTVSELGVDGFFEL